MRLVGARGHIASFVALLYHSSSRLPIDLSASLPWGGDFSVEHNMRADPEESEFSRVV